MKINLSKTVFLIGLVIMGYLILVPLSSDPMLEVLWAVLVLVGTFSVMIPIVVYVDGQYYWHLENGKIERIYWNVPSYRERINQQDRDFIAHIESLRSDK